MLIFLPKITDEMASFVNDSVTNMNNLKSCVFKLFYKDSFTQTTAVDKQPPVPEKLTAITDSSGNQCKLV